MKKLLILMIGLGFFNFAWSDKPWAIGVAKIRGLPVVYKFLNKLPEPETRSRLPWLTVISWKYDGSTRNGMPPKPINQLMIKLEDGLYAIEEKGKLYLFVYAATGNNLKQFVFYISSRKHFLTKLNKALKSHPRYPIKITFYKDTKWKDLKKLHQDFRKNAKSKKL